MLIKAGKVVAIVVGTYIAGALMLGGRDRLKVRLRSGHVTGCKALPKPRLSLLARLAGVLQPGHLGQAA